MTYLAGIRGQWTIGDGKVEITLTEADWESLAKQKEQKGTKKKTKATGRQAKA